MFISHSKDLSQTLFHLISTITKIPLINLFMQGIDNIEKKHILIGSPLQLNNLEKKYKDAITQVVIVEADYLFGFGYGEALDILARSINDKVTYKISCIEKSS